jgi:large subunit ribosomal protein L10
MRQEKATIVEDLSAKLNTSPFLIIVDYTGLKVDHFAELRKRLSESGSECHVVKNSMLRRAISKIEWPEITECLAGQNAMVTGPSDICAAAKVLKTFAAEFTKPEIRGGILDRAILSVDQIIALADLPPKEMLQAQLLGLLMAPATRLVRVLNEPAASLARLLQAKADQASSSAE